MTDTSYERPCRDRSVRRERRIKDENRPKIYRWINIDLLITQVFICVVIVSVTLAVKAVGGEPFSQIKSQYVRFLSNPRLSSSIQSRMKEVPVIGRLTEKYKELKNKKLNESMGGEDVKTAIEAEPRIAPEGNSFAPAALPVSLSSPIKGELTVTSTFGYRADPIDGTFGFHTGTDIKSPAGTKIYAAYDGVVTEARKSDSWGCCVTIRHGLNINTFYAHCSELLVSAGTNVRKGEAIAKVGSTGKSTGPHLHFEIWVDGIKTDPRWNIAGIGK